MIGEKASAMDPGRRPSNCLEISVGVGSMDSGLCRQDPNHYVSLMNEHEILYAPVGAPAPVAVTLPDRKRLEFAGPVSGADIAAAIGPGLAKAAIAVRIDGRLRDLATVVDRDAAVAVITRDAPEGLEILRHDAAHVMAEAVQELYPGTQVTFGPATETGFYYDFAREAPFTTDDLEKIEARMREIVKRDEPIVREELERDAAVRFFKDKGEK